MKKKGNNSNNFKKKLLNLRKTLRKCKKINKISFKNFKTKLLKNQIKHKNKCKIKNNSFYKKKKNFN